MTAKTIATVRGELLLVIAGADPICVGKIEIPVEVATELSQRGELVLRPVTPVADVRALVEQVFQGATL